MNSFRLSTRDWSGTMADKPNRPRHPRAWSSHGEANRNSGNFTRGSQLIGHQFSMWWRGARVPILVWIGLLLGFAWLKLTLILDDYEFRSEEHTSELQSLMRISYAVFCLKKKKK